MAARLPIPVSPRVRPFADADYVALSRIRTTGEGEPTTPEVMRERDTRIDRSRYEQVRVVAVDEEDAPLGYGELYQEPSRFEPRRYYMRLAVDLRMRRRGIGEAIWRSLRTELERRDALGVYVWARDATAGRDFIAKRGFREVLRWYVQVRPTTGAPLPTPSSREELAAGGVRIATLAGEMARDADALSRAHALYFESRADQATLGRVTPTSLDEWRITHVDDPGAILDAYFIAIADSRFVGQTVGWRSRSEDVLDISVTGVLPEYRRRGIARALKLELHAYARANGYREIHTRTARENTAMVALNSALGYAIVESYAGYELRLGARSSTTPSSP